MFLSSNLPFGYFPDISSVLSVKMKILHSSDPTKNNLLSQAAEFAKMSPTEGGEVNDCQIYLHNGTKLDAQHALQDILNVQNQICCSFL